MLQLKWSLKIIGWVLFFGYKLVFTPNPQINGIIAYASEDSLRVDFSLQGVWEGKIAKTLLAGIPLNILLNLDLLNSDGQVTYQKTFFGELVYDVWEEKFSVQQMSIFPSTFYNISELQNFFERIEKIGLVPLSLIHPEGIYRVRIDFSILLSYKKQKQELKRWMEDTEQTEEEFASGERSTGFRLNINRLVQLFFSNDQKPEEFKAWGFSAPFTFSELILK